MVRYGVVLWRVGTQRPFESVGEGIGSANDECQRQKVCTRTCSNKTTRRDRPKEE